MRDSPWPGFGFSDGKYALAGMKLRQMPCAKVGQSQAELDLSDPEKSVDWGWSMFATFSLVSQPNSAACE
jgi:hypothetical protein